jgi:hypothetical protein
METTAAKGETPFATNGYVSASSSEIAGLMSSISPPHGDGSRCTEAGGTERDSIACELPHPTALGKIGIV